MTIAILAARSAQLTRGTSQMPTGSVAAAGSGRAGRPSPLRSMRAVIPSDSVPSFIISMNRRGGVAEVEEVALPGPLLVPRVAEPAPADPGHLIGAAVGAAGVGDLLPEADDLALDLVDEDALGTGRVHPSRPPISLAEGVVSDLSRPTHMKSPPGPRFHPYVASSVNSSASGFQSPEFFLAVAVRVEPLLDHRFELVARITAGMVSFRPPRRSVSSTCVGQNFAASFAAASPRSGGGDASSTSTTLSLRHAEHRRRLGLADAVSLTAAPRSTVDLHRRGRLVPCEAGLGELDDHLRVVVAVRVRWLRQLEG